MLQVRENKSHLFLIALAVIGFVFVLLRGDGLLDHCLWFDEIYSAHAASMPVSQMISFIAQDLVHPPLFYLVLNFWVSVFGDSMTSLRAFPLLFSVLSLVPSYLLMKQLKLSGFGIFAGLLFIAANGMLIKYSQEVRMYSMVVTLSILSTLLFERFFRMGKGIIALTIVNTLLFSTHYFGFVLIVAQISSVLIWQRIKIRPIAIAGFLASVPTLSWMLYVFGSIRQEGHLEQNIGWIPTPGVFAVVNSLLDFTEPIYFDAATTDLPTNPLFSIPMLLLVVVSLGLVLRKGGVDEFRVGVGLFPQLAVVSFGFVIVLALSLIMPHSIWGSRHLLVLFGPFVACVAIGLSSPAWGEFKSIPKTALCVIVLMAALFGIVQPRETRHLWCAWEKFAVFLDDRPNRTEPLYFVDDLAAYHFWYFSRSSGPRMLFLLRNDFSGPIDDAYFLPRGFEGVKSTEVIDSSRPFMMAFTAKVWNEDAEPIKQLRALGCQPEVMEIFEANRTMAFLVRCG